MPAKSKELSSKRDDNDLPCLTSEQWQGELFDKGYFKSYACLNLPAKRLQSVEIKKDSLHSVKVQRDLLLQLGGLIDVSTSFMTVVSDAE